MSQWIDEFFKNHLEKINEEFLLINQITNKPMTKLFEIEEQAKYDGTRYYLKIDGSYQKSFATFEEAKAEYEEAITWIPTKTILLSKEVEL
jgi:hypothetical protein